MHRLRSLAVSLAVFVLPLAVLAAPRADSIAGGPTGVSIAQESDIEVRGDFIVSPTHVALEMAPGEERAVEVSIISREGKPASYSVGVEDFSISDDGLDNIFFYGQDTGPFPARSWLTPMARSVTLQHGERAVLPVRVTVPRGAVPGDHYAAVLVQRLASQAAQGGFAPVTRIGTPFLITVAGSVSRSGSLERFSPSSRVFWSLPVRMVLEFRNTGMVFVEPEGHVQIRNLFGMPVDDIPLGEWFVLRDSTRSHDVLWQPRFALGRYTATISLAAVTGEDAVRTVSFWVVPVLPVLLTLLAVFCVSFLVQVVAGRTEK